MTNSNNFNIKQSFSIVELMVSLSILFILGLMMVSIITKKLGGAVNNITGEEYVCYRDNEDPNKYNQIVTIYHANGSKEVKITKKVSSCSHKLSERATNATIYLVGAGGGGGGSETDNISPTINEWGTLSNKPKNWTYQKVTSEKEIEPLPPCYDNYYYYADGYLRSYRNAYADCYKKDEAVPDQGDNSVSYYRCGTVQPQIANLSHYFTLTDGNEDSSRYNHNGMGHIYCHLNGYNYDDASTREAHRVYVNGKRGISTTSKTIENKLSDYMNHDLYNRTLLSNSVVSIYGGGMEYNDNNSIYIKYHRYFNLGDLLQVGSTFFCLNGQEATTSNGFHISPTPGVIYANDKLWGVAWGNVWNSIWYGNDISRCNYAGLGYASRLRDYNEPAIPSLNPYEQGNIVEPEYYERFDINLGQYARIAQPHYYYTLYKLQSVKLPYGTVGKAGKTLELKNINLSKQKVILPSSIATIGKGGIGGPYEQKYGTTTKIIYTGKSGGATTYTLTENGQQKKYSAAGGYGGTSTYSTNEFLLDELNNPYTYDADNKCAFNTPTNFEEYKSSYNEDGAISDYISKNPDQVDIHPAARTYFYNDEGKLEGKKAPDLSFGAGGAGVNSRLLLYSSYLFGVIKKTQNSNGNIATFDILVGMPASSNNSYKLCSQTKFYPTYEENDKPNNNGNGGAIIIRWGDAIR